MQARWAHSYWSCSISSRHTCCILSRMDCLWKCGWCECRCHEQALCRDGCCQAPILRRFHFSKWFKRRGGKVSTEVASLLLRQWCHANSRSPWTFSDGFKTEMIGNRGQWMSPKPMSSLTTSQILKCIEFKFQIYSKIQKRFFSGVVLAYKAFDIRSQKGKQSFKHHGSHQASFTGRRRQNVSKVRGKQIAAVVLGIQALGIKVHLGWLSMAAIHGLCPVKQ